jgi:hypothetical protein
MPRAIWVEASAVSLTLLPISAVVADCCSTAEAMVDCV